MKAGALVHGLSLKTTKAGALWEYASAESIFVYLGFDEDGYMHVLDTNGKVFLTATLGIKAL